MNNRVEAKVTAAASGAALAGLVVTLMGEHVFNGDVPQAVTDVVYVVVPALVAFAAGWWTRHTPRPDDPTPP
ncbi:hypothetical protein [Actinomadura sp. NEAU-AAG7]|uniref:hypothetical protein n=1 Tax=Actinomadura sp. NEAU-AAG7 TaxID=2839640 RepID=UPI001BE4BFEE|nr:hypothetical protein [Actinomadura sp. NEAU-AAG7]MBT2213451.1 hypothetical protein [Actinomadura sp. NEAU-AAG7]